MSDETFDLSGLLPVGYLVPWEGDLADIPEGWALADGTNGTVDAPKEFGITIMASDRCTPIRFVKGICAIQKMA